MAIPLVSIIIPNYNHAPFLKQRIDGVLQQSYQNFEVILLDDCSNDDSKTVLETYRNNPKVTHIDFNSQNSGSPFKQWQKGITLAKGEYIWIAESDDYCSLNFLERILKKFHQRPNLGLVYTQSTDVDEKGKFLAHRADYTNEFQPNIWKTDFSIPGQTFIKKYLAYKNVIPNASAMVFKKEIINNNTFSNQLLNMKMCGDWLFWISACLKTDIGFIAEELNFFRNHSAVSRNHKDKERKKLRLLEEKTVRDVLNKNQLNSAQSTRQLYQKWGQLHTKKELLSRAFYRVKLKKTTIFSFLYLIIKYKSKR